MTPLLECVPNFSEGRNRAVIRRITEAIEAVEGVTLLDVDSGRATNRTVVTFAGPPEPVVEAAFRAVERAAELIDMRRHTGAHPRFGATDVCPLVPIRGMTMEETVALARELGRRIGEELGIPVYLYEHAAFSDARRNLADIRAGEYEGLEEKLRQPAWRPDFGPARFNAKTGAIAVGAREVLVAYNVNLNTTSVRRANAIAFDVREKGRIKRAGDGLTGPIVRDARGEPVWIPGSLRCVKAIGWYIEEYGIAQVSMNLTNLGVTPIHTAFEEVCRRAEARGVRVTGSEIVGLVPLEPMLAAGRYFLAKQQRSLGVPDRELLKIAIRSLGLNDLYPFKPEEKIIEYRLADRSKRALRDLTLEGFVEAAASEAPAPGGGSVAAAVGALGAALGAMVANLSAHKRGWDDRWAEFSELAVEGKRYWTALLELADEDTAAFNRVLEAYRLPQATPEEASARQAAIVQATRGAIEVPLRVMHTALEAMGLIRRVAETGLPSSVSDAGVGAICARAAVAAARLNVLANVKSLDDRASAEADVRTALELDRRAEARQREILELVEGKLAAG